MTQKRPRHGVSVSATWLTIGIAAILVAILPILPAILAIVSPILAPVPPVPPAVLPPVAAVAPEAVVWTVWRVWMWRPGGPTARGACGTGRGCRAAGGGRGAAVCAAIHRARAVTTDQIPHNDATGQAGGQAGIRILALHRLVLNRPLVETPVVLAQTDADFLAVRCAADEI